MSHSTETAGNRKMRIPQMVHAHEEKIVHPTEEGGVGVGLDSMLACDKDSPVFRPPNSNQRKYCDFLKRHASVEMVLFKTR